MTRPGVLNRKEKTAMKRFVGAAILNIVPESMKEDFLDHYNCRPPPIFMVLISIIEVHCCIAMFLVLIENIFVINAVLLCLKLLKLE